MGTHSSSPGLATRLAQLIFVLILGSAGWSDAAAAGAAPAFHKFFAPPGVLTPGDGVELWHDYDSFGLYRVTPRALRHLPPATRERLRSAEPLDRVLLDAYPFTTQGGVRGLPEDLRIDVPSGLGLQLIQFVGPMKEAWLDEVRDLGIEPIHAITHHAYLVWTGDSGRDALQAQVDDGDVLQLSLPYHPYFKLGPSLRRRLATATGTHGTTPEETVQVTVQMFRHPGSAETEAFIAELAVATSSPWTRVLKYQNRRLTVRFDDVGEIARRADVVWIGEHLPRELADEVQAQILAGDLDESGQSPAGPGYLDFLTGLGFSTDPLQYPILDIADDGIGDGSLPPADTTFYIAGDNSNPSRLLVTTNCTGQGDGGGPAGHGHLNASIAAGYDDRVGFPYQDLGGYRRGLGINPFGWVTGTRIFDNISQDLSGCGGTDTGLIRHLQNRNVGISSNSWGCSGCAGLYDDSSQAFDVGTRDADLFETGTQPMLFVFAAGNEGPDPGTIRSPGNAKNVLTVGAVENVRPSDEDGPWTDGCGFTPEDADNAMEITSYSSRGPAPGGRAKPDVVAPGTHVQGTASTHPDYSGFNVCDTYRPFAQFVYAASTGTSFANPAISGLASLVWSWLEHGGEFGSEFGNELAGDPSPALIKAYLLAHPTYVTGSGAGDDLPGDGQGYGRPDMRALFSATGRVIVDQSEILDEPGDHWRLFVAVEDPAEPVRIVLSYTDQAGAIGTSPLVNDLDLTVRADGIEFVGNNFSGPWSAAGGELDRANNTEAVFLPPGTDGLVDVTVTAFNVPGDGVPGTGDDTDQDFALVCSNCLRQPLFTLDVAPAEAEVCAPGEETFDVTIGSVLGFTDAVMLSTGPTPAGLTAAVSPDSVSPPGAAQLSLTVIDATPGDYTVTVGAESGLLKRSADIDLTIADAVPASPPLAQPKDGATGIPAVPTFTWNSVLSSTTYFFELATDLDFTDIVYSAVEEAVQHTLIDFVLEPDSDYYWRVRGDNACGEGAFSSTFHFATRAVPPVLLVDDDDNSPDVRGFYTAALDDLGVAYDVWDTVNSDDEPGLGILALYRTVVWFSGAENGDILDPGTAGPGAAGESSLAAFLDLDRAPIQNCLFLSSQDYLHDQGGPNDLATAFMTDYLGLGFGISEVGQAQVLGAGSIFGGFGPFLLTYPFTNASDILTPNQMAELAFQGNQGDAAILIEGDTYGASWWGFPFEALPGETVRTEAMRRILQDFCGLTLPTFFDSFESGDTSAWSTTVTP